MWYIDEWNILPLLVVCVVYGWLATWTYGLSVSSGLFVPSLLIGALWGRVVGMLVMAVWPAAVSRHRVLFAAQCNRGLCRRAVPVCLSVCPSVSHIRN